MEEIKNIQSVTGEDYNCAEKMPYKKDESGTLKKMSIFDIARNETGAEKMQASIDNESDAGYFDDDEYEYDYDYGEYAITDEINSNSLSTTGTITSTFANGNLEDGTSSISSAKLSAAEPGSMTRGKIVDFFDGESKDGTIDETSQHSTGDCWLLSGINALSYTEKGQEIIENCLEYEDGYTIVHLATGDVKIDDSEVTETKGSFQYSSGDDDMIILELAVEKTLDGIATGDISLSEDAPWYLKETLGLTETGMSSTYGGYGLEAMYYLTGIEGTYATSEEDREDMLNTFIANNGKDYAVTASMEEDTDVEDVNGDKVTLHGKHVYAVKSADEDTVTVTNPWDSGEDIVLSKDTFLSNFLRMQGVDLSESGNDGAYLTHNSYSTNETINGEEYVVDYDYDEDGNYLSRTIRMDNNSAGIQYTYDEYGEETARLCLYNEDGSIEEVNWELSNEQVENILDRGLLAVSNDASSLGRAQNDLYVSGLADMSDKEWKKVDQFMKFTENDQVDLQTLGKVADLNRLQIHKIYKMLKNDSTKTLYDAYNEVALGMESD